MSVPDWGPNTADEASYPSMPQDAAGKQSKRKRRQQASELAVLSNRPVQLPAAGN